MLALSAVTGFRYRPTEFKRTTLSTRQEAYFWLKPGDLLITRSNTPELVGHAAIYDGSPTPCIYPDLMMRLEINERTASQRFVWYWLQTPIVREFIHKNAKGTSPTMKKISQSTVMAIPFPSLLQISEQRQIVTELDTLQAEVDVLKYIQTETTTELDVLLSSILDQAFKGELISTGTRSIKIHALDKSVPAVHPRGHFYRRAAIDAYLVNLLRDDRNLGRTKIEKITHLLEYHCGIDLGRKPIRDAAGPNDYVSRRKVENLAVKQQWYSTVESDERRGLKYIPGPKMMSALPIATKAFGSRQPVVNGLLAQMRPLDTKQCEIVATLYAVWNDLLLEGNSPTDNEIISEARDHWHPSKRLITLDRWIKGLEWLRQSGLIPRGTGKPVCHPKSI